MIRLCQPPPQRRRIDVMSTIGRWNEIRGANVLLLFKNLSSENFCSLAKKNPLENNFNAKLKTRKNFFSTREAAKKIEFGRPVFS